LSGNTSFQELLGHKDVWMTTVYTRVRQRRDLAVHSPMDLYSAQGEVTAEATRLQDIHVDTISDSATAEQLVRVATTLIHTRIYQARLV